MHEEIDYVRQMQWIALRNACENFDLWDAVSAVMSLCDVEEDEKQRHKKNRIEY